MLFHSPHPIDLARLERRDHRTPPWTTSSATSTATLTPSNGHSRQKGVFRHPDRQAIFLGDFSDRGPQIRETLEIVRPMIDSGAALSVMGNYELNALAF